jgi:hypothetical protein
LPPDRCLSSASQAFLDLSDVLCARKADVHLFWMLSFQAYEIRTKPPPGFSASPLVEGERTEVRGLEM